MGSLPEFVAPMLAKSGAPFDSEEHFFEIKWDGIRALIFVEEGDYRLVGRNRTDLKPRYPEAGFAPAEPGLVLDGELVVLADGVPDFSAVLQREQARNRHRIQHLVASLPVTYVVFDVLYRNWQSCMDEPLTTRREILAEVLDSQPDPRVVLSDGVAAEGTKFFQQVRGLSLEGMVAKRLTSTYESGLRSGAWTKIKERLETVCAVVGFLPDGDDDLKSLHVATQVDGELRYVGRVGSGLTRPVRMHLRQRFESRLVPDPWIECEGEGLWIEPGLYCKVGYLELTKAGSLRAPVFLELLAEDG